MQSNTFLFFLRQIRFLFSKENFVLFFRKTILIVNPKFVLESTDWMVPQLLKICISKPFLKNRLYGLFIWSVISSGLFLRSKLFSLVSFFNQLKSNLFYTSTCLIHNWFLLSASVLMSFFPIVPVLPQLLFYSNIIWFWFCKLPPRCLKLVRIC